ncbi:YicC/YloC family endoribonuclease [Virgibacillus kimchii]
MTTSMTGYGLEKIQMEETTVTVEIRTVNHRFFDFTAKIPRTLLFLEDTIKKELQSIFSRGRIEVYIHVEGSGFVERKLHTDWNLMSQYIQEINEAKERYGLAGEIPATFISSLPEIITVQETEQQPDYLREEIIGSVKRASMQVLEMRKKEGAFLETDLKERIETTTSLTREIEALRPKTIEGYKKRIAERIEDNTRNIVDLDDTKVQQEIILLAEKGDISEELTRLYSHLRQFSSLLQQEHNTPVGRKLDFIVQEMHREANTIGSKSTDAEMNEKMILLKSELEKIKEQVQNIE